MSFRDTARFGVHAAIALGCLLFVVCLQQTHAAKPGGGGGSVTHTSQIYFNYQGDIWRMFEDGSGKTQALPDGVAGVPSSQVYDGSRWWLTLSEVGDETSGTSWEIVAFRDDGTSVQLTACAAGGVYLGGKLAWSNDQLDTFASNYALADLDGQGLKHYVVRLPIIGDIELMADLGLLPLTANDCEFVLPQRLDYAAAHAWSSDPSKLAYVVINYSDDGQREVDHTLWVRTLPDDPGCEPVDQPIYSAPGLALGAWSPDGARISFYLPNSSTWGGVFTIRPDGGGTVQVVKNNGLSNFYPQGWSPDSRELLIASQKINIDYTKNQYQLARTPAEGGKLTVLTSDLAPTGKTSVGWFVYP